MTDRTQRSPLSGTLPDPLPTTPVRLQLGAGALAIGVLLVISGSFLPWLVSGSVTRNSYQVTGIANRLEIVGSGVAGSMIGLWPLLGPTCFLPVIAALVR